MENTSLVQLKIFFTSGIYMFKIFNTKIIFLNILLSNCDPEEGLSILRPN